MTPDTRPDDRFEERLLTELRAHVARQATPAPPEPGHRAHRSLLRAPRVAAGVLALAAGAVGAILALSGGGTPAAYAVEPQGDGTVTVEIRSLSDAGGLRAALAKQGINAKVVTLPAGQMCKAPGAGSGVGVGAGPMSVGVRHEADGTTTFSVDPGNMADDTTLLIASSSATDGRGDGMLSVGVVASGQATCDPVTAPAPPANGADSGPLTSIHRAHGTDSGPRTGIHRADGAAAAAKPSLGRAGGGTRTAESGLGTAESGVHTAG